MQLNEKSIRHALLQVEHSKVLDECIADIKEKSNMAVMKTVQHVVYQILKDRAKPPISNLSSLRFLKNAMQTFNDEFISEAQYTVLPMIEKIALTDIILPTQEKGKKYFQAIGYQDEESQQIGNNLVRLSIECIRVWSKWFPIEPLNNKLSLYKITECKIRLSGVKYSQLQYFEFNEIAQHIPEKLVRGSGDERW